MTECMWIFGRKPCHNKATRRRNKVVICEKHFKEAVKINPEVKNEYEMI